MSGKKKTGWCGAAARKHLRNICGSEASLRTAAFHHDTFCLNDGFACVVSSFPAAAGSALNCYYRSLRALPAGVSISIVCEPEVGSSHLTAPVAAEVEG